MTTQHSVKIFFEGAPVEAEEGESVAAALQRAGVQYTSHHGLTGEHRAPFCMMGVCFECMVNIDGHPNQQACLTTVREGMRVRRQQTGKVFEGEGA
ncbi:MAG TPA: (2Fe-2S)-binding protein [Candidatus Avidesulfovibrio excrementigallinarum]|nr:(2Fe-2S)-binding protein [Candidatus Avidesulfovibrio excrementigallinarum]